jgi:hypothetical protein
VAQLRQDPLHGFEGHAKFYDSIMAAYCPAGIPGCTLVVLLALLDLRGAVFDLFTDFGHQLIRARIL